MRPLAIVALFAGARLLSACTSPADSISHDVDSGAAFDATDEPALCFDTTLPNPPCALVSARPFDRKTRCLGARVDVGPLCYSCLARFPATPIMQVCGLDSRGAIFVVPKPNPFEVTGAGWQFRRPSSMIAGGGDGSDDQRACDDAYALAAVDPTVGSRPCAAGGTPIDAGADGE
jgi:hypothetical protein